MIPLVGFLPRRRPAGRLHRRGDPARADARRTRAPLPDRTRTGTSTGCRRAKGVFLACSFWLVEVLALQGAARRRGSCSSGCSRCATTSACSRRSTTRTRAASSGTSRRRSRTSRSSRRRSRWRSGRRCASHVTAGHGQTGHLRVRDVPGHDRAMPVRRRVDEARRDLRRQLARREGAVRRRDRGEARFAAGWPPTRCRERGRRRRVRLGYLDDTELAGQLARGFVARGYGRRRAETALRGEACRPTPRRRPRCGLRVTRTRSPSRARHSASLRRTTTRPPPCGCLSRRRGFSAGAAWEAVRRAGASTEEP